MHEIFRLSQTRPSTQRQKHCDNLAASILPTVFHPQSGTKNRANKRTEQMKNEIDTNFKRKFIVFTVSGAFSVCICFIWMFKGTVFFYVKTFVILVFFLLLLYSSNKALENVKKLQILFLFSLFTVVELKWLLTLIWNLGMSCSCAMKRSGGPRQRERERERETEKDGERERESEAAVHNFGWIVLKLECECHKGKIWCRVRGIWMSFYAPFTRTHAHLFI